MDRHDAALPPVRTNYRVYPRAVTIIALSLSFLALPISAVVTPAAAATLLYSETLDTAGADKLSQLQLAQKQERTSQSNSRFDHLQTGFSLTGAHRSVRCESCHVRGIFTGTPKLCVGCHSRASRIATTVKPAKHIPSSPECDLCHTPTVWSIARFNHNTPGLGGTPRACIRCHNGTTATGKPGNHLPTTASCDSCHSSRAWVPAIAFDHAGVPPGTCAQCHNGTTATGKPGNHLPTTASCDSCHSTTAWRPATFDHSTVAPGTCASCHNGTTATGKPSGHFVTTRSCDACHSTSRWLPVLNYSHTSPFFPSGHRASVTCDRCHTANSALVLATSRRVNIDRAMVDGDCD
jgi:hypothetical protein